MKMSRFLKSVYTALDVYTPGEQPKDTVYTKLNTNESPYPPGPKTVRAVADASLAENLRKYCDPDAHGLKRALAEACGVQEAQVFVSNGSDDILNFAFMAFSEDGVCFPEITYGFYPVFAMLHGLDVRTIPLKEDFSVDPEDYMHAGRMVVLANPNAPTGIALSLEHIAGICRSNPEHVVLIDEAYVDFGTESALKLVDEFPNLLVVQTFSKSRSLAGARIGFAVAQPELIADLERIKYSTNPYNVNTVSQAAGVAALEEDSYYRENCRRIMETRAYTVQKLDELGFRVVPSTANFVFARHPEFDGGELDRELKERKVLIRHFDKKEISQYNRITIGSREEMDRLLAETREILSGKGVL